MDHAVALVQAYLHANGYFTVAEHPVLERLEGGGYQSATDVDLLALRLPGAGGLVAAGEGPRRRVESESAEEGDEGGDPGAAFVPDPALAVPSDRADLIIAEVKEGQAVLNQGGFRPDVLEAVLLRFGAAGPGEVRRVVAALREKGEARLRGGASVRIFAFGSVVDPAEVRGFRAVSLVQVSEFLGRYVRGNWSMLRHAQIRHPALGFLALEEQIRRAPKPPGSRDEGDRGE